MSDVSAGQPDPYGQYPTPVVGAAPYAVGVPDLLVPPPGSSVDGWFSRCLGVLRRGWAKLLTVYVLSQLVPLLLAAAGVAGFVISPAGAGVRALFQDGFDTTTGTGRLPDLLTFYGLLLGAVALILVGELVGQLANTWLIVRQAAGLSASIGAALRYGCGRLLGLFGWKFVAGWIMIAGFICCVLPMFYVMFALFLLVPAYVFERRNPISRSWRMTHANCGPVLGRAAILVAVMIAGQVAGWVLQQILTVAGAMVDRPAVMIAGMVLGYLVTVPLGVLPVVAATVTYAEQRALEGPISATSLAVELEHRAVPVGAEGGPAH